MPKQRDHCIALLDARVCLCRNTDRAWMEERGAAEPVDEGRARESVHAYAHTAAAGDPKLTDQNAPTNMAITSSN